MIRSMTAFSRQQGQFPWGTAVWELRSVNHRYLEPSFKLPESMRAIEPALRDKLRKQLNRGKVESALRLQFHNNEASGIQVNQDLLAQLIAAGEAVQSALKSPAAINPLEVLQWPGILSENSLDSDELQEQVLALFQETLEQLITTREREGAELKAIIEQRLDAIDAITEAVRKQMPLILEAQQQKIMRIMPFLMPIMLYSAPSGLTLYICASTGAGIIDSYIVRKHVKELEASGKLFEKKKRKPGGIMHRLQMAAEQAQQAQQQKAQQQNAKGEKNRGPQNFKKRKR